MGTPFHHKGRVKNVGVDCGGLLHCVYGLFYPVKPFPTDYPADWALHDTNPELYLDFIDEYVVQALRPVVGGITVFQFGRRYAHGAIFTADQHYIHAWGRTAFGMVQKSHPMFFVDGAGRPRKRMHFDLKEPPK